jgi:putative membrane protein
MIGIWLGYGGWFLPKTPVNLILCFALLVWIGDLLSTRKMVVAFVFFLAGMLVEWVGVTYGFPFGEYRYGNNLGPKLDGVPYLIGINWAMLIMVTGSIAAQFIKPAIVKVTIGAALMVLLDFFIEQSAPAFDFWHWSGAHIPINNYIAWFVVSYGLHWIFQAHIRNLNFKFSLNLYLAQLVFFASSYVYSQI